MFRNRADSMKRTLTTTIAILVAGLVTAAPASAQWTLTANDGKAVLNLGFLSQAQVEVLRNPGSHDDAQNVFVRRARLMLGGRVDERTSFYIDTDVPNLGKGQATGAKVANTMILQDVVLTQALGHGVKIDAGMMMMPISHNSQQSVGTLLAVDYGPYSFLQSDATDSRINRDYGVDARAYLAQRHAELRAGLFQGDRGRNATAPFRTTVRGVWYPFEADTGFFYSGTAFGKRRTLALGGSYDAQSRYYAWAGDAYLDWPLHQDCVTLQADVMRYDGRTTFAALPRQDVVLVEAGYFVRRAHLTPYVQYAERDFEDPRRADEVRIQGGLAFWGNGHRNSVKLGVAKLTKDNASDGAQYVAQWQVLAF
jgi:hypothetical protein